MLVLDVDVVQWRRCLKFSGETAVEKCTLDGVRGLRVMLGATTHDILYYMSPIYCQDIIDSVLDSFFPFVTIFFYIFDMILFQVIAIVIQDARPFSDKVTCMIDT